MATSSMMTKIVFFPAMTGWCQSLRWEDTSSRKCDLGLSKRFAEALRLTLWSCLITKKHRDFVGWELLILTLAVGYLWQSDGDLDHDLGDHDDGGHGLGDHGDGDHVFIFVNRGLLTRSWGRPRPTPALSFYWLWRERRCSGPLFVAAETLSSGGEATKNYGVLALIQSWDFLILCHPISRAFVRLVIR